MFSLNFHHRSTPTTNTFLPQFFPRHPWKSPIATHTYPCRLQTTSALEKKPALPKKKCLVEYSFPTLPQTSDMPCSDRVNSSYGHRHVYTNWVKAFQDCTRALICIHFRLGDIKDSDNPNAVVPLFPSAHVPFQLPPPCHGIRSSDHSGFWSTSVSNAHFKAPATNWKAQGDRERERA